MLTIPFVHDPALTASGAAANCKPYDMDNLVSIALPWPALLVGASLSSSASLTAGSITFSIIKNGSTSVAFPALNASNPLRRTYRFAEPDVPDANHVFARDDRVQVTITPSTTLLPTGGYAGIVLFFTPFARGI